MRKLRRKLGHSILGLGVVKKKEIDRDGGRGISLSLSLSLSLNSLCLKVVLLADRSFLGD